LQDSGIEGWEEGAIEWLVARILEALARAESVGPLALALLLRHYAATDRADIADALGAALASAAEQAFDDASPGVADWLTLFVEAAALSDDGRMRDAGGRVISTLRQQWGGRGEVEPAARSVGACLAAADLVDPPELVPVAIDELERVVGIAYRPGAGLAALLSNPEAERGHLGTHVRVSAALLTGYQITGRLPYAMLAEELMQFTRRESSDEQGGGFGDRARRAGRAARMPFVLNCEAARVLIRLAALHDTAAYREAAVLAPDADYARDAGRVLRACEPAFREHGVDAAVFGLALTEWARRS
jgi:hypothetical protein